MEGLRISEWISHYKGVSEAVADWRCIFQHGRRIG
jgi:hypothetical protein